MRRFLRYITNNEAASRHEEVFDEIFWIIETLAPLFGTWILHAKHTSEWIPFLVIETVGRWTTSAIIVPDGSAAMRLIRRRTMSVKALERRFRGAEPVSG